MQRTGQLGVPVIIAGDEVIVGFDRPRLERLAARYAGAAAGAGRPKLGIRVRDLPAGGVEVGGARPGSLGERLGVQAGDILEQMNGQPIRTVADLERLSERLQPGQLVDVQVRRQGRVIHLTTVAWPTKILTNLLRTFDCSLIARLYADNCQRWSNDHLLGLTR